MDMSFDTRDIRNVVLLGHSGSGKTTFAETMLFEAGEISRRGSVEDGNTVSDYTDLEKERGGSVFSALMHVTWRGSKINIIDTPGLDDFVGEVVSSMKVGSTGVIVLNARSGVEVGTELVWDYLDTFKAPAIFVINQMDHEKADFENTLSQATARFGSHVLPFQYPLNSGSAFNTIIDVLRMVMYVFPAGGGKPEKKEIPATESARAKEMHNAIVEAAAENDEGLMELYFEKGTLSEEELARGLRIGIANHQIFPVFCCSSTKNMGSGRIMGFVNDVCPTPLDRKPAPLTNGGTLACDSSDATTVFIYKTISEPRVGLVSYFKVYSGVLRPGDELVNAANRGSERFGQVFIANGKDRIQVDELRAGDIGVTVKLKNSHTNNTLNARGTDRALEPMHFPETRVTVAIEQQNKADMEKLMKALHTLNEEDPTLIVEQSAAARQIWLHGQGELHLDLVRHRVEMLHGVSMGFIPPRIVYRETITKAANTQYRHKKQTGGAGQFAEVHMRLEPFHEGMPDPSGLTVRQKEVEDLPWGGKLAFYWCIVGGSIDSKFSNAIKKGILQKMERGPLTGSYCQDIRVSIYDGKMHPVDSNDQAFMTASSMAFRQAFREASPQVMEPIMNLEILCPDEATGDIMGDLQTRRAMIMGMDSDGHFQKIIARAPQSELYLYSSTLRSISQGRAHFHQEFADFNPVPSDVQQKLIDGHHDEAED
ncbi:MAG: hypothetical protein RL386_2070 [Bacteroidota bacterium]